MRLRKILFNPGQIPINCPLLYEGVFYGESLRGNTILENSKHSRCIYTRRFPIKETLSLNLKNACWECLQHQQSWCHPLPLQKDRTPMANRTRPIIMRLAVTEYEKELIERKMQQLGTKNFGAYARKMLIDGYMLYHQGGLYAAEETRRRCQPCCLKYQSDLPPHQLHRTLLCG